MSSQETDHVSPTEVTPELGKGALDTWRLLGRMAAGLIKPAQRHYRIGGETGGKGAADKAESLTG